jgi:Arc/MetJ-type ribon-helix-helix transcriptional regulator
MVDVISLRLSEDQMKAVDDIVQSGEFGTRAEFVKYCVRMTLKSYAGRSPPPSELKK